MQEISFEKRRLEWSAGRMAAKLALRQLHLATQRPVPAMNEIYIRNRRQPPHCGQPQANCAGQISISHSHEWAVALAGEGSVGIDVEQVRCFGPTMREMALSRSEKSWVAAADNTFEANRRTTMIWSFKEAFMKSFGFSVFGRFQEIECNDIREDGRISWRVSAGLEKVLAGITDGPFQAFGGWFGQYALVIAGDSAGLFENTVNLENSRLNDGRDI